jgi:hypothetical protein
MKKWVYNGDMEPMERFDEKQREMFREAIDKGEPIEEAMLRIKKETLPEYRRILAESDGTFREPVGNFQ